MKKIISILLSIMLITTFMPIMAYAYDDDDYDDEDYDYDYFEEYDISFGEDEYITPNHISGKGWSFNHNTNTLELNNYNATLDTGLYIILYDDDISEFNLVVHGNNTIKASEQGYGAINMRYGKLNIKGDGTLNLGTSKSQYTYDNAASYISGSLAICDSVILNVEVGKSTKGQTYGFDVYKYDSGENYNGSITVKDNAKVNISVGNAKTYSSALYSENIVNIQDNAVLNLKTGNTTKAGSKSVALYGKYGVNISGKSEVHAQTGSANDVSYAICADKGNINISGGNIEANAQKVTGSKSKKYDPESCGIYAYQKNINISNAVVNAKASSGVHSDGLYAKLNINITDSVVNAVSGKAKNNKTKYAHAGIYSKKNVTITNSQITSTTTATKYAYGIYAKKLSIKGANNFIASGKKAALNVAPSFSNCIKEVYVGKSASSTKLISKPSKKTYTGNKYLNIITTNNSEQNN